VTVVVLEALEFLLYAVAFWVFVCSPARWPRWLAEFRKAGALDRCMIVVESAVCAACGLAPVGVAAALLP
jgi:hypothetical protein